MNLLNAHYCMSSAYKLISWSDLDIVDFAANFPIHTIFKNTTFYLESVVLESHSSTNSLPK